LFSSLFMLILILLVNASIYYLFYQISTDSELEQLMEQTDTMVQELADKSEVTRELFLAYLPANGMARVFPEAGQPLEWHYKGNAYTNLEGEFNTTESQNIVSSVDGSNVAVVSKPI